MSIRFRTEIIRVGAGLTAGVALGTASALHAGWAAGLSWPRSSQDELADLAVAAGVTARATCGQRGRLTDHSRTMATVVSASLLARGVGGVAVELAGGGDSTPEFRRWNRRLYNPLCLTLAMLVAIGRRSRP